MYNRINMCLNFQVFSIYMCCFSTLRLYNSTLDKIDMAYIKTPCPNRDIVKVLKIQQWVNLNGVTPEHGHNNDGTSRSKSNQYKINKL